MCVSLFKTSGSHHSFCPTRAPSSVRVERLPPPRSTTLLSRRVSRVISQVFESSRFVTRTSFNIPWNENVLQRFPSSKHCENVDMDSTLCDAYCDKNIDRGTFQDKLMFIIEANCHATSIATKARKITQCKQPRQSQTRFSTPSWARIISMHAHQYRKSVIAYRVA